MIFPFVTFKTKELPVKMNKIFNDFHFEGKSTKASKSSKKNDRPSKDLTIYRQTMNLLTMHSRKKFEMSKFEKKNIERILAR